MLELVNLCFGVRVVRWDFSINMKSRERGKIKLLDKYEK